MSRGLPAPSEGRLVFVAGKGGVGKTTVAGAIAVRWADRGVPTHLLSADPAHSLADLFGQDLRPGRPAACRCAPGLTLEELDAPGAVRDWLARARRPIRELMLAGTYLDGEDVDGFLEGPLPGADELMAALRLVELAAPEARERGAGAPDARVIVDMAPAGHALRLLEAGAVARQWHAALAAMARKATVVASRLARREVRLEAEELVDALGRDAERFESMLRRDDTCAVVVSRPGAPVREETRRLREALAVRGLRVAREVLVRGDGAPGPGCDALRVWASEGSGRSGGRPGREGAPGRGGDRPRPALRAPAASGDAAPARAAFAARQVARADGEGGLGDLFPGARDLLLFVGKGGVGKTTCAVACALGLSGSRRVALLGTDPAGAAGGLLARVEASDAAGPGGRLRVRSVDADRELRRFRERHGESLRALADGMGLDERLALDRAVVESMLDLTPPGMDELFALAVLTEPRSEDVLVVDTSPTGHFLRLLETPELVGAWTRSLMRFLLKYREVLGLGDLAERLVGFSRRIRELRRRLTDRDRTGVFPVMLREPLVEAETARLCAALDRAGLAVPAVVVNRCAPREVRRPWEPPPACGDGTAVVAAPALEEPVTESDRALDFFRRWERVA